MTAEGTKSRKEFGIELTFTLNSKWKRGIGKTWKLPSCGRPKQTLHYSL